MKEYKSLDEVIEEYKAVKSRYHIQLENVKSQKIPDYKSLLANTYRDLERLGAILERNGIDISQFNKPYEK